MDGQTQSALGLVLAIFRLAVADYVGVAYGHDEAGRPRAVRPRSRTDAEAFLRGPWAACLGDWVNLSSATVWREARAARTDQARLSATHFVRVA